jgi:hypothetical protein
MDNPEKLCYLITYLTSPLEEENEEIPLYIVLSRTQESLWYADEIVDGVNTVDLFHLESNLKLY